MSAQPQQNHRVIQMQESELADAIKAGIIAAMQSEEAQIAVSSAVARWFDRQSGKAMRRILGSLAIAALVFIASNGTTLKRFFTDFGK